MFIYGPSVTENIDLQNNDNLDVFFKYYKDSVDKDKQVKKAKDRIESRIRLVKYCK